MAFVSIYTQALLVDWSPACDTSATIKMQKHDYDMFIIK